MDAERNNDRWLELRWFKSLSKCDDANGQTLKRQMSFFRIANGFIFIYPRSILPKKAILFKLKTQKIISFCIREISNL